MKTPHNILFVHYGEDWIRGSEQCLIRLIEHLDPDRFRCFLWTNNPTLAKVLKRHVEQYWVNDFSLLLGWTKPRWSFSGWFEQMKQARSLIRSKKIDLVHCNSAAPAQWMVPVCKWLKTPSLVQLHAPYQYRDRLTLLPHFANHLVAVSNYVAKSFRDDGIDDSRITVIPNGTRTKQIRDKNLKALLGLHRKERLIVSVGSLIERKGMDIVIRAVKRLNEQGPSAHLAIVGDGEERVKLQMLAGDDPHIHFLGELKDAECYLTAHIDLLVSGARDEAFGLTFIEAAVVGIASVAPRVGGIPEVVEHGSSGLLYAPENVNECADNIAAILSSPEKKWQYGFNAKKIALEKFSVEHNAQLLSEAYLKLIANPRVTQSVKINTLILPAMEKLKARFRWIRGGHYE